RQRRGRPRARAWGASALFEISYHSIHIGKPTRRYWIGLSLSADSGVDATWAMTARPQDLTADAGAVRRAGAAAPQKVAVGASTMVATAVAMSFGDALVKHASADFTLWQIYVLRSLLAISLIVAIARLAPHRAGILPRAAGWACLRSLLLMMMWLAFYAALSVLSLPI